MEDTSLAAEALALVQRDQPFSEAVSQLAALRQRAREGRVDTDEAAGELDGDEKTNIWHAAIADNTRSGPPPAPPGVPRCRECGCWDLAACWTDAVGACWWVEEDLCSHCAPGAFDNLPVLGCDLEPVRARDWLRSFVLEWRDSMLLELDDGAVLDIAAEDGIHLTCPGDIQRERDRAVLREVAA